LRGAAVEQLDVALVALNLDNKVVQCNSKARQALSLEEGELGMDFVQEFVEPSKHKNIERHLDTALQGNGGLHQVLALGPSDGSPRIRTHTTVATWHHRDDTTGKEVIIGSLIMLSEPEPIGLNWPSLVAVGAPALAIAMETGNVVACTKDAAAMVASDADWLLGQSLQADLLGPKSCTEFGATVWGAASSATEQARDAGQPSQWRASLDAEVLAADGNSAEVLLEFSIHNLMEGVAGPVLVAVIRSTSVVVQNVAAAAAAGEHAGNVAEDAEEAEKKKKKKASSTGEEEEDEEEEEPDLGAKYAKAFYFLQGTLKKWRGEDKSESFNIWHVRTCALPIFGLISMSAADIIEDYSQQNLGWEPQMLAIWEYMEKNAAWHSFSKDDSAALEVAHEKKMQTYEVIIHGDHHSLWINQRKMTNIETKDVYNVRRRLPFIKYTTAMAGAIGKGKAIATTKDQLDGDDSDDDVGQDNYAEIMMAGLYGNAGDADLDEEQAESDAAPTKAGKHAGNVAGAGT